MKEAYCVAKLRFVNIDKFLKIAKILYNCGKKMRYEFDLRHWDNSYLKMLAILCLTGMKNDIYYVCDQDDNCVATFQIKITGTDCCFEKLATAPIFAGKGIGTYCLEKIESMALRAGCQWCCCEVYDKSLQAIRFYEARGYTAFGERATRKYTVLQMRKSLRG